MWTLLQETVLVISLILTTKNAEKFQRLLFLRGSVKGQEAAVL
jgi:hypothetical protein